MAVAASESGVVKSRKQDQKRKSAATKKLSRTQKPDDMTLEAWQVQLRRQFGAEQRFRMKNLGDAPVFSEFEVTNPQSGRTYRVAIRGEQLGANFCSCPDFATNTLGTCKHVEFVLNKLRRKRGGKKALDQGYQPVFSEVYLQYGSHRVLRFSAGSECPAEFARLAEQYFDDEGTLLDSAVDKFDVFLSKTGEIDHELRVYDDALSLVAEMRDARRRCEILDKAFPAGIKSQAFDNLLKFPLYDYQREGALFAVRAGRSLIGDEMGLGKTIQAIAAVEIMAQHFGVERVLIICPTSLKHQWQREIGRFTERPAQTIGGPLTVRHEQFAAESFYKITNYDTVYRDLNAIAAWSPDLVILDEAQRIKNWDTRTARSVKRIASPYSIVLTGTPLENRLQELVSIVQFVDQHRLGPTFQFLHRHQQCDEQTGRVIGYRDLDKIGETLRPLLIRRRKSEVLKQLPERLEKHFFVPMTPQQWRHHDDNRETVARVVSKWERYGFLTESDQRRLMIALQNMRMSCDSTYLLDKKTDHGTKADELATLLEEIFEQPETKVVIFSQWVRMHELIQRRFEKRGWDHVLFSGSVPSSQRKSLIDRFRDDAACRLFLSTDAGGVGLNLQHASVVVNMDLPWNPAVLEQRIGRVHRLGQTQPVRVVNFVAEQTIEHGMLSVLDFKQSLFSGVLDGGEKNVFLGKSRLKKFMETVRKATSNIADPASRNGADADGETQVKRRAAGEEPVEPRTRRPAKPAHRTTTPPSPADKAIAADPLTGLIENGLALLQQLVQASQGGQPRSDGPGKEHPSGLAGFEVVRDEDTDTSYMKIPMPKPQAVQQAVQALMTLVESLR